MNHIIEVGKSIQNQVDLVLELVANASLEVSGGCVFNVDEGAEPKVATIASNFPASSKKFLTDCA